MNRRDIIRAAMLAGTAAAPTYGRAASGDRESATIDVGQVFGPAQVIGDLIGSQYEPYTLGFRKPDPWGVTAWREVSVDVCDVALFNNEGSNPSTVTGKIVGIDVRRDSASTLQLGFTNFDNNIRFMRNELQVRKIDFTVWGTPRALSDPTSGEFSFFHAPKDYAEYSDIVTRAVRHIADELRLPGSTYKPWTEPDSGYYWRGRRGGPHDHEGQRSGKMRSRHCEGREFAAGLSGNIYQ